ncbi:MAG: hypothetical protein OXG43_10025 [Chloroflexi bacterium]|nr:hypothetical protein [Chloroflexota bacterium]
MERLRWPWTESPRLITALAILPLTPLLASVVYRLTSGTGLASSPGLGAYLSWHTAQWTVLLVAFAVALVPAGLVLMRRPDTSASRALGLLAIAFGIIALAYAVTNLLLYLPRISPQWLRMVVALSIVPAAAGILLLQKRSIASVQALGILAIALGVIGAVYYLPRIPIALTLDVPLWDIATFFASAISLTLAPIIVGVALIQSKGISSVQALGIVVIMLGVIGAIYTSNITFAYVKSLDRWNASVVVHISTVVAAVIGPAIAGILMIQKRELSVIAAMGLTATALGVIGTTYSVSALVSILLLASGTLYIHVIALTIFLFAALIVALSVVPLTAGVVLVRRTQASGAWALGLMAIVFSVVGMTYSAAQLAASGPPGFFNLFVGIHLLNTHWLP